jgi:hypothetical protein
MGNELARGEQSAIYVNTGTYDSPTWTEIDLAADINDIGGREKVETPTRAVYRSGVKRHTIGMREVGWSFPCYVPEAGETNTAYDKLVTAYDAKTPVDILVVEDGIISTDGLRAERAVCHIFDFTKPKPIGQATMRNVEVSFCGSEDQSLPETGTTSSGEFVASS